MPESRRIGLADVLSALPDFALGAAFLAMWVAPDVLGVGRIADFLLIMLLEFISIHSAAFMGLVLMSAEPRARKIRNVLALGAFYSLFAGGFSVAFKRAWPFVGLWILIANRLAGGLGGRAPTGKERELYQTGWAVSIGFYVVSASITVLPLPELGVTSSVRVAAHLPGSGDWVDHPHRLLAFGFLYFTATALWGLFGRPWMRGRAVETARR